MVADRERALIEAHLDLDEQTMAKLAKNKPVIVSSFATT
jgi:hypothetical protein